RSAHWASLPGLCLGQEIHAQEGALPRPSISAEPGSMIPWGRPMTIVCRAPAGFEDSRLEKEGSSQIWDKRATSPSEREARFLFPSMTLASDPPTLQTPPPQERHRWLQRTVTTLESAVVSSRMSLGVPWRRGKTGFGGGQSPALPVPSLSLGTESVPWAPLGRVRVTPCGSRAVPGGLTSTPSSSTGGCAGCSHPSHPQPPLLYS
uniref:Ig-like domain-containing protein n=1 Tax=Marmota marmota marmota TaxID=9994 RepID=A0A8C5YUZ6_MARMA